MGFGGLRREKVICLEYSEATCRLDGDLDVTKDWGFARRVHFEERDTKELRKYTRV